MIALRDVSVAYEGVLAVDSVSLTIHPGEYAGVVGPTGSGKTSLLKAAAGAIQPVKGIVDRAPGTTIGYVAQVGKINWSFPVTVRDVLGMAADRSSLPWLHADSKKRMNNLLERLGLEAFADRHIGDLSGGQQQRVFVARALMGEPGLILLDEPTSGMDVSARHEVLHLLHDLNHEEGIAVVVTTHDLTGIAAHMHHLICLNKSVIAAGSPAEVLSTSVLERTYGTTLDVLVHGGMTVVVDPHLGIEEEPHHDHSGLRPDGKSSTAEED